MDYEMVILVDADACPVREQIEMVVKKYGISSIMYCDTNHEINSDCCEVKTIGAGKDAVDLAIVNNCNKGDIVVTQDYGLAALILSKSAYCIHPSGMIYDSDNIDRLLLERHIGAKERKRTGRHIKGRNHARSREDDERFYQALNNLVLQNRRKADNV